MSSIAEEASLMFPDLRNLPILFLICSLPELVDDFATPDLTTFGALAVSYTHLRAHET